MSAAALASPSESPSSRAMRVGSARKRCRNALSVSSRASNRSTSACISISRLLPATAHGQGVTCALQLLQQRRHGRISSVALQYDGERIWHSCRELAQKLVDRLGHVVQMVVKKMTFAAVRRGNPLATRNMHAADTRERQTGQELQWIETEVDRIGVEIVQIEKQAAAAGRHDINDPGRF